MATLYCRDTDQTAAACAKANGWPAGPGLYSGEGTPEGSYIGYWPNDQYLDTVGEVVYAFNGTPGTNTGWIALN